MKVLTDRWFLRRQIRAAAMSITSVTIGIALWVFAATVPVEAAEMKSLTVAMSVTPLSAPIIIAAQQGYFANNGLDVTIRDVIGGYRAIKAVFEGKADIATSSEVVVMFNSFKRSDFTILGTFTSSENDVKIVTRKDTGIRTVSDLVHHRVGTVTGTSAQFFLDETLVLARVDRSLIDIVHVNPEDSPSALASGDVDVVVVWEPYIYLTQQQLGENAVLVLHDHLAYTETFNAVVLRDYADKNPDVMGRFIRALIDAVQFINARPEESQRIVAERLGSDLPFIKAVWGDFEFDISLHQWLLNTMEGEARWALGLQLVAGSKVPNYLEFLHLKTLNRVLPEAVTVYR